MPEFVLVFLFLFVIFDFTSEFRHPRRMNECLISINRQTHRFGYWRMNHISFSNRPSRFRIMSDNSAAIVVVPTAKPKRARSRKSDSNKENVDPLAVVKPKRTRAVTPKEPKVPKVKVPRVKKQKPAMRVLNVADHEAKEAFEIPAQFACSSCKKPHSISEHVVALPTSSKVFQTCQDCRAKGIEFYRRQKRIAAVNVDTIAEAEGGVSDSAVTGVVAESVQV